MVPYPTCRERATCICRMCSAQLRESCSLLQTCPRRVDQHGLLLFGRVREDHVADKHPGNTPYAEEDKVEEQIDRVGRRNNERAASGKQRYPCLPTVQLLTRLAR